MKDAADQLSLRDPGSKLTPDGRLSERPASLL